MVETRKADPVGPGGVWGVGILLVEGIYLVANK